MKLENFRKSHGEFPKNFPNFYNFSLHLYTQTSLMSVIPDRSRPVPSMEKTSLLGEVKYGAGALRTVYHLSG